MRSEAAAVAEMKIEPSPEEDEEEVEPPKKEKTN